MKLIQLAFRSIMIFAFLFCFVAASFATKYDELLDAIITDNDEAKAINVLNSCRNDAERASALNRKDSGTGATVLHWAAMSNYSDFVKIAVSTGNVNVGEKNKEGQTPLSIAIGSSFMNVVKALLKHPSIKISKEIAEIIIKKESKDLFYLFYERDKSLMIDRLNNIFLDSLPAYQSNKELLKFILSLDAMNLDTFMVVQNGKEINGVDIIKHIYRLPNEYSSLLQNNSSFGNVAQKALFIDIVSNEPRYFKKYAELGVTFDFSKTYKNVFGSKEKMQRYFNGDITDLLEITPVDLLIESNLNNESIKYLFNLFKNSNWSILKALSYRFSLTVKTLTKMFGLKNEKKQFSLTAENNNTTAERKALLYYNKLKNYTSMLGGYCDLTALLMLSDHDRKMATSIFWNSPFHFFKEIFRSSAIVQLSAFSLSMVPKLNRLYNFLIPQSNLLESLFSTITNTVTNTLVLGASLSLPQKYNQKRILTSVASLATTVMNCYISSFIFKKLKISTANNGTFGQIMNFAYQTFVPYSLLNSDVGIISNSITSLEPRNFWYKF